MMRRSPATEVSMIRRVPESTKTLNRKAYAPRLVGIGPYHHFHPQLYKMEGVKLAAAKSGFQRFNIPDLDSFLRRLRPLMPRIRACYDGFFLPELEWVMAVDGLFLLSLLCDGRFAESAGAGVFFGAEPEKLTVVRKLMSVMDDFRMSLWRPFLSPSTNFDDDHRRPAVSTQLDLLISAVVNDAVLVENQVPISILAEAVAPFRPDVAQLVARHLHDLCTFLSPVQTIPTQNSSAPVPAMHLLEYLYLRITSGDCNGEPSGTVHHGDLVVNMNSSVNVVAVDGGASYEALRKFSPIGPPLAVLAERKLVGILLMLGRLTSFGLMDYFIPGTPRNEARTSPTAAQLGRIGLRFEPKTTAGLAIELDEEAQTIAVPVFRWHPHSDVVTRNLVAYEASAAATDGGSDVFAQYVHFLHMVARTRQDVELLIKTGVVVVTSKNNDNAANATAAVRFFRSPVPPPPPRRPRDNMAVAVKRYYNSRRQVVACGLFVKLGYVLALLVMWAAEAIAVYVVFCGILKKVTGCSFGGGDGSCTVNVVTPTLMSVVDVHGNTGGIHQREI